MRQGQRLTKSRKQQQNVHWRTKIKGVFVINCGMLRYPMTESLARQASFFANSGLSGYDAFYAALAKELNGKWLTFDNKAHKLIKKAEVSHALSNSLPANWEN